MPKKDIEIKRVTNGKITLYRAIKTVKKSGNSGHVIVPREIIGKMVRITLEGSGK
ncbi:MAG: DUF2080 family transposase-associated protein [Patescibacteria group bacterium]|nr:DUF2080 family transposase-associated protein [Patescibacteria group bacterium]